MSETSSGIEIDQGEDSGDKRKSAQLNLPDRLYEQIASLLEANGISRSDIHLTNQTEERFKFQLMAELVFDVDGAWIVKPKSDSWCSFVTMCADKEAATIAFRQAMDKLHKESPQLKERLDLIHRLPIEGVISLSKVPYREAVPKTPGYRVGCSNCNQHGNVCCNECGGRGDERCYGCQGRANQTCLRCGGSGQVYGAHGYTRCGCAGGLVSCGICGNRGRLNCHSCGGSGTLTCQPCAGSGAIVYGYEGSLQSSLVVSAAALEKGAPEVIGDFLGKLPFHTAAEECGTWKAESFKINAGVHELICSGTVPLTTLKLRVGSDEQEIRAVGWNTALIDTVSFLASRFEKSIALLNECARSVVWNPFPWRAVEIGFTELRQTQIGQDIYRTLHLKSQHSIKADLKKKWGSVLDQTYIEQLVDSASKIYQGYGRTASSIIWSIALALICVYTAKNGSPFVNDRHLEAAVVGFVLLIGAATVGSLIARAFSVCSRFGLKAHFPMAGWYPYAVVTLVIIMHAVLLSSH